jgi:FecR-like protein
MGIIELLFGRKNQPETEEVDRRLGRIGARMVIEGPTELQRVSPMEAVCPTGRMVIEVPPPARGFHLETPQLNVADLGTSFGVDATRGQTEVHLFKVEFFAWTGKKQYCARGGQLSCRGARRRSSWRQTRRLSRRCSNQLKLLWPSCGNKDGLIRISQGVHSYLKEKQVPHVWHVDGNGHDATHWRNNLWLFSQRIFK